MAMRLSICFSHREAALSTWSEVGGVGMGVGAGAIMWGGWGWGQGEGEGED